MTQAAPDLTPGYPSNGAKLGPAWAELWRRLELAALTSEPYLDGRVLAEAVAKDYGLADSTLIALLSRAAKAGILASKQRQVEGARGMRKRAWYRSLGND